LKILRLTDGFGSAKIEPNAKQLNSPKVAARRHGGGLRRFERGHRSRSFGKEALSFAVGNESAAADDDALDLIFRDHGIECRSANS
jgi:hypothetical protein